MKFNHSRREHIFADILLENGFSFTTHDKRTECSLLRPDFVFDALTHIIVIEYDELQHGRSSYKCEMSRMKNLYMELGAEKMTIIRFNPDAYTRNGIKHNEPETERHGVLFELLETSLKTIPENPMEIHYLFYNDNILSKEIVDTYEI